MHISSTPRQFASSRRQKTLNWRRRHFLRPKIERLEERRLLATISWDGGGGSNHDWSAAANWFDETNLVNDVRPGPTDDVQIGAAFAGITITHATANTTIRSLTSAASLQITSGSFSILATAGAPHSQISNSLSVDAGTFTLNNATLDGPGQMTNASSLTLSTSTINASLENRGSLSVTGNVSTINGAFHNAVGASLSVSVPPAAGAGRRGP